MLAAMGSTAFAIELRSSEPISRDVANQIVLGVYDAPPPWVKADWTTMFGDTWVPVPGSRARGSSTNSPSRGRIRAEMAKARPGVVIGTGLEYQPADATRGWTTVDVSLQDGFTASVRADLDDDDLADPALQAWVDAFVAIVSSLVPGCARVL
jgi:hypothetical protein